MKTYPRSSPVLATLLVTLLSFIAPQRLCAQGAAINIQPNVTRITDATTGQLVGPGYAAAIFWASSGESNPDAFLQVGANMNVVNGLLAGGSRTVVGAGPGAIGVFAAAWETQHGSTYNAAAQVPGAKVGRSAIVGAIPGGPAVRIPDFQVAPVPEPSTWAFLGLGLIAITLRHKLKARLFLLVLSLFAASHAFAQPITSADAVGALIQEVRESDLARNRQKPLLTSLAAALRSFEQERINAANNQLRAFQNKVRAQVRRHNPALAAALIAAAQQIIDGDHQPGLVFDLSSDFSLQTNPAGPWSYGYSATLGGPFQLFTTAKYNYDDRGTPVEVWAISEFTVPAVMRNATTNTVTSDDRQGIFPPGTVWFYPGPSDADDGGENPEDNFGVLRFTVPADAAGTYDLAAAVRSAYTGPISGDTDFHVLLNGTEIFGRSLPAEGSATFNSAIPLVEGDTIDFVIGRGADDSFHGSGLIINATLTQVQ